MLCTWQHTRITNYAAEIKLTRLFVYEWGKSTWKNLHRVILRSPLLRIHYYHNKRLQVKESQYLIPTYNWTFTLIPSWTYSVVTISPFNAWFQYVTNQFDVRIQVHDLLTNLGKMLIAKFFSSSHDEDHEAPWLQNPTVYKHSTFFKRKMN